LIFGQEIYSFEEGDLISSTIWGFRAKKIEPPAKDQQGIDSELPTKIKNCIRFEANFQVMSVLTNRYKSYF